MHHCRIARLRRKIQSLKRQEKRLWYFVKRLLDDNVELWQTISEISAGMVRMNESTAKSINDLLQQGFFWRFLTLRTRCVCCSQMQAAYENTAWQLYLRECALRTAREEVAFLESTGGATPAEIARIRERVLGNPDVAMEAIKIEDHPSTVSLKSVLSDFAQDTAVNQLCRRVKPVLEQLGVHTFRKHQAIHVLRSDAPRVREIGASVARDE
jgi:hypothetical protein